MPKRDIALYIVDIFVAIDKIWRYTSRFSDAQEFLYSELSWDASIRELEIVGEATKHLLVDNILPENYRRIVNFRNQINHAYFGIDENIVWDVIQNKLPLYNNELKAVVKQKNIDLKIAIEEIRKENYHNEATLILLDELEIL